ncbi:hypothetical protein TNCV_3193271 [Trichonephila clavipes]|nr:hypothetical protein TNCV_3193271 [Trichonephila clavipes]
MWRELEDYSLPSLVCLPFHCREVRHEMGSTENGYHGAAKYVSVCVGWRHWSCCQQQTVCKGVEAKGYWR